MPHCRSIVAGLLAVFLSSCVPVGSTIAPSPGGLPGSQNTPPPILSPAEPAPAAPQPVRAALDAEVVFPAGTLALLQAGLRTQSTVSAKDLSPADLAKLLVTVDGRQIPASQLSFPRLQWDSAGGIRISMIIDGQNPPPGGRITVALPNERLTLIGTATGGKATIQISLATTARALLQEATAEAGQPSDAVPNEAVAIVAERLGNAVRSTATTDPFAAPMVTSAIQALAKAIGEGVPPAVLHTLPNLNPVASSGGGGGSAAPVVPAVTTISPDKGPLNTKPTLTVTGSNFVAGATVIIGGVAADDVTVDSATQITLTVPAGLASGPHDLTITNPDSQFVVLVAAYTVTEPAMTGITPATGDRGQATSVTIAGSHFAGGATVMVGAVMATAVTVSADGTGITASIPAGLPPGAHDVVVTNVGGGTATLPGGFTATGANPGVSATFQPGQPFAGTPVVGSI